MRLHSYNHSNNHSKNINNRLFMTGIIFATAFVSIGSQAGEPLDSKKSVTSAPEQTPEQTPKKVVRRPPLRKLDFNTETLALRVTIRPGVPKIGETVSVTVEASEILATPDVRYGRRKPIEGALLKATLLGPKTKKRGKSAWVEQRLAHPLADPGSYGFSFTAPTAGVYTLGITGSAKQVGKFEHNFTISYDLWPIPADGKKVKFPRRLAAATVGDLTHGQTLCERFCVRDADFALPAGGAPVFLKAETAATLTDSQLLNRLLGEKRVRGFGEMERHDLTVYLRSLHSQLGDFFPRTGSFFTHEFTINEYGLERLAEHNIKLDEAHATGTVFILYKDKTGNGPQLVDYEDRVARDNLNKKDKIGYLLFFSVAGEKRAVELGMALGLEPTYPIKGLIARNAKGKKDAAYNKQLRALKGQGRFNNRRSIRKGSSALRRKLVPLYLKGAEFATMYYAAEREFTQFDDEFNE